MAPRGRGRGDRTLLGRARRTFAKFEFEFLFVFFAGAFYLLCKYWLYVSAMARPAPLSLNLLKTYSFRPLTPPAISIAALLASVRSFVRSIAEVLRVPGDEQGGIARLQEQGIVKQRPEK